MSKGVDASGNATTFVYGQGIVPLMVKASGVTQKYLLASGKIVSEWDGTSTTNHRNFLYTDALGSVAALTNQGATIVRNTTYDPYGKLMADSGTVTLANEYVGAYGVRDINPGSTDDRYIMGVREYNAYNGRFLSEDPLGYKADGNVYRYARNNPLKWIDPKGLNSTSDTCLQNCLASANRDFGNLILASFAALDLPVQLAVVGCMGTDVGFGPCVTFVLERFAPAETVVLIAGFKSWLGARATCYKNYGNGSGK